jgi:hypothetical protein
VPDPSLPAGCTNMDIDGHPAATEGADAWTDGKCLEDNPYDEYAPGLDYQEWREAWLAMQDKYGGRMQ